MIDKETGMSAKERMGEEIATLAARIDAATYELLVLIRKFDEREGWNCGFLSCAHWLTWRIGLTPSAARERVRVARALGELPLMSDAMKRGELSYSKVRALTRIAQPDTEQSLVDLGKAGTAAHAECVVRKWRRIDRTVEASDDELRDASSHLTTHIDENGMFVIRGRLAPEAGEVLMKALKAAGDRLYAEQPKDRPPAGKVRAKHCDAHHIVHWADGGETKLSNLVLLCRRHHRLLHEGEFRVRMSEHGAVQFVHPRGQPLEQSPAPPPLGLDAARELVESLEDAGILITGKESMPTWDGRPMDLPYVMECLWRPPPHLEDVVARERAREGPRQSRGARAA